MTPDALPAGPELLPCPWCGSQPELSYRGQPAQAAALFCYKCKASGPESRAGMTGSGTICDPKAFWGTAINAWNTRHIPTPPSGTETK